MTKRMLIALARVSAMYAASYVVAGFCQTVVAQTRRPLQPDDIFALKTVGDPRISPDGAWIA